VRRQGRIEEAVALVDAITPRVERELAAYDAALVARGEPPSRARAFRMEFDRAMLHFTNLDFTAAIVVLGPLVAETSTFGARVLATALQSACYAMRQPPDLAKCTELIKHMGEGQELGRMDQSILIKRRTLMDRNSKALLGYELLYVFGHLKCFAPLLTSDRAGNLEWLAQRRAEVDAIARATGLSLETVLPRLTEDSEKRKAGKGAARPQALIKTQASNPPAQAAAQAQALAGDAAENQGAADGPDEAAEPCDNDIALVVSAEELTCCVLIASNISALMGDLERAELQLEKLSSMCSEQGLLRTLLRSRDPYVIAWAEYELAAVKMRRQQFGTAKTLLERAKKRAQNTRAAFSFQHMLDFKCSGAIKECQRQLQLQAT
jgi:hypothetical protein